MNFAYSPGVCVLVAEAQPVAGHVLAQQLQDEGCEVRLAHTGADALRMAAERPADVVLVDTELPDLDGYELAKRLRAMAPDHWMLIVAMTDSGGRDEMTRFRESGVALHFLKPVDPGQLTEALRLYRRSIRPTGEVSPARPRLS